MQSMLLLLAFTCPIPRHIALERASRVILSVGHRTGPDVDNRLDNIGRYDKIVKVSHLQFFLLDELRYSNLLFAQLFFRSGCQLWLSRRDP